MKHKRTATVSLITVICAVYLWQLLDPNVISRFALGPWAYMQQSNEWYRLFSVALVHDQSSTLPLHLAFNMLALYQLGNQIEHLIGRSKFLAIFFFSLLCGSLVSSYLAPINSISIGASGAVFGLFGAIAVIGRRIGANINGVIGIVAVNFLLGFTIGGVDWRAHLGGLIGGAAISSFLLARR